MTDKPAPKRVRSRARPKALRTPEQIAEEQAFVEAGGVVVGSPDEARRVTGLDVATPGEVGACVATAIPAPAPVLTAADLRAELDSLSATRTQVAGAITATAEQHARLTSDLTRVDGALQIVGQLIERLEAKAT